MVLGISNVVMQCGEYQQQHGGRWSRVCLCPLCCSLGFACPTGARLQEDLHAATLVVRAYSLLEEVFTVLHFRYKLIVVVEERY